MKAVKVLLSALILAGGVGCDSKPGDGVSKGGAGVTEPSPNAPGVGEQPSTKVSPDNYAKQPTQGPAPNQDTLQAESPVGPDNADPDKRGTTRTPEVYDGDAGAGAGATADPSRGTGPSGTPIGEGMPGQAMDGDAKAVFKAAPGIKLKGEAELEAKGDGVEIEVEVANAPPGPKGIHIHQKPDCTDIPAKSMGDHFAPDVKEHGLPNSPAHHLGDLGNINIDEDGKGELEIKVAKANLKDNDPLSLLGRAIVIHEKNDEGAGAQPSGNSGKPIACAVIKPD